MAFAIVLVVLSLVKKQWILKMGYGCINFFSSKLKFIKEPEKANFQAVKL